MKNIFYGLLVWMALSFGLFMGAWFTNTYLGEVNFANVFHMCFGVALGIAVMIDQRKK
jgi:hypothetical protein